jgi:hypothetical protein
MHHESIQELTSIVSCCIALVAITSLLTLLGVENNCSNETQFFRCNGTVYDVAVKHFVSSTTGHQGYRVYYRTRFVLNDNNSATSNAISCLARSGHAFATTVYKTEEEAITRANAMQLSPRVTELFPTELRRVLDGMIYSCAMVAILSLIGTIHWHSTCSRIFSRRKGTSVDRKKLLR